MKNIKIIGFLFFGLALWSCGSEDDGGPGYEIQYSSYKPVLMDTNELFKSISFGGSRQINSKGKLIIDGNNLFVIEIDNGVHFYDNTNPSNPVETGFLTVPGCRDINLVKNVLYVSNSVDLVVIDISNPKNPVVGKRSRKVFTVSGSPDRLYIAPPYNKIPANTVIVGWKKVTP